ncbi:MAG TPA: HAMP domain-containing sensor histidine kinase [Kofleriaceae bacterium]|nr:HAMP domain-containing sensor histidine kinase [Kofleriaceae bacterium]
MTISFRFKLLASHALVALVVSAVTLVVVERLVSRRMEQQLDHRLETQARAVATWLSRAAHPGQLAHRLADVVDARVTIIDKRGIAVGESQAAAGTPPRMDSEGSPQEVADARAGAVGRETRFSSAEAQPVRYIAVPAPQESVVRLGVPIGEFEETKSQLRTQLFAAALASLLLALGLAALVAGPLTRRLRDATVVAQRIGAGNYDAVQPSPSDDEVGVLSRALARTATELRATEQHRREFLANVAHEVRTPVTSIRGYAELLKTSDSLDETGKEFATTIHRNALRIGQLVEDLLELEAIEAGKGAPLAAEPVALAPVVQHVIDTLKARVDESGASIRVDVSDLAPIGDEDAVERIILNLVDNALRHGGAAVQIDVAANRADNRIRIVVKDSGPGIPAEDRDRMFERFHRGAAARDPQRRGTGLGLAIARELAVAMHGSLTLGEGSTFTLELPA